MIVDRGFQIDDLCNEKGIILIRLPFLKGKSQFTKSEVLLTKEIASVWVHIKRVNQSMKIFKVLQNKFCWGEAHLAYDILIIISGICNLSPPIFSSHKIYLIFKVYVI